MPFTTLNGIILQSSVNTAVRKCISDVFLYQTYSNVKINLSKFSKLKKIFCLNYFTKIQHSRSSRRVSFGASLFASNSRKVTTSADFHICGGDAFLLREVLTSTHSWHSKPHLKHVLYVDVDTADFLYCSDCECWELYR